mmetsp:Transcript_11697/g.23028  ORF Transcript_11697/g.23028 Transcript_11697/m.23028 type:complete len:227 (+) Transcript_11697:222-902(+)
MPVSMVWLEVSLYIQVVPYPMVIKGVPSEFQTARSDLLKEPCDNSSDKFGRRLRGAAFSQGSLVVGFYRLKDEGPSVACGRGLVDDQRVAYEVQHAASLSVPHNYRLLVFGHGLVLPGHTHVTHDQVREVVDVVKARVARWRNDVLEVVRWEGEVRSLLHPTVVMFQVHIVVLHEFVVLDCLRVIRGSVEEFLEPPPRAVVHTKRAEHVQILESSLFELRLDRTER